MHLNVSLYLISASKVYLCPFFVEEAFHRWITVGRYKLDVSEQEEVEAMILRIKNAEDEPALVEAQRSLVKSNAWAKNQHLQDWFCDLWIPHIEVRYCFYWGSEYGLVYRCWTRHLNIMGSIPITCDLRQVTLIRLLITMSEYGACQAS
jgi:hypothetical protein